MGLISANQKYTCYCAKDEQSKSKVTCDVHEPLRVSMHALIMPSVAQHMRTGNKREHKNTVFSFYLLQTYCGCFNYKSHLRCKKQ